MPERPTVALEMGAGLDRVSGTLTAAPARAQDLRNMLLFEGRARVRPGSALVGTLPSAAGVTPTDIVGIAAYKQKGRLIILGAAMVTGKWNVYLYEADTKGQNPVYRAPVWLQLEPQQFPIVTIAESYGKVFFAHAYWPYQVAATIMRAVTRYWDGAAMADYPATDLGGGAEVPRFAGVYTYLNYLVGWGYGNKTTPDRGEIVRVSVPGDPLTLRANDYAIAGQPAQPVLVCRQAGDTLQMLKETEAYALFGFDTRTFGIRPADLVFGVGGPRLAVTVGSLCYAWSHQGPRAFAAEGPSVDIAQHASLMPLPDDMPKPGDPKLAHATWDPQTRRVLFFWPNPSTGKTLVVALGLWDERKPRWGFDIYDALIYAANPFSVSTLPPPAGTITVVGTAPHPYSCDVSITEAGGLGDETLQVWLRDVTHGGSWAMVQQPLALAGGGARIITVSGLTPATDYEVAFRYERGGQYNAGSSSQDPDTWPAAAQAAFSTSAAPIPPANISGVGRCYDAANGIWGVVWDGVPATTGSAQIAIKYAGPATDPAGIPAPPATPPPTATLYNVDPDNATTKSTAWKQNTVGTYSVYYAWARATGPDGAWTPGYKFWVLQLLGGTPAFAPDFYDAAGGPFPATGACAPAFLPLLAGARAASLSEFAAVADIALFLGLGAVPQVWRQDFIEFLDGRDPAVAGGGGRVIVGRVRTNRVAPTGASGESIYTGLVLISNTNTAGQVTVTPVLDDQELPSFTLGLMPTGPDEPVSARHELVLMRSFVDATPRERLRYRPRGGWFQVQLELQQLAAGVLQVDSVDLEYEPVRETMLAEAGP